MRAAFALLALLLVGCTAKGNQGAGAAADLAANAFDLTANAAEPRMAPMGDDEPAPPEPPRPRPYSGPAYFPASLGVPTLRCRYDRARLQPVLSDFVRDWYSRQLAAAAEPSLYLASQAPRPAGSATLRFTWLRSFHAPVTIRIETAGPGRHRLVAKQLSGAGGYEPGHVERTIDRVLSAEEVGRLQAILARARVFALAPDPCRGGTDGSEWIFESVDAGGYHYAAVWSPDDGPAHALGRFLMGLTGWEFSDIY